jgi:hypothetical protein
MNDRAAAAISGASGSSRLRVAAELARERLGRRQVAATEKQSRSRAFGRRERLGYHAADPPVGADDRDCDSAARLTAGHRLAVVQSSLLSAS